jgi:hypothetical protein
MCQFPLSLSILIDIFREITSKYQQNIWKNRCLRTLAYLLDVNGRSNSLFLLKQRKEVSTMKKIPFSSGQKNSIVSFLLVQLFALLFIAVLLFAVTKGGESIGHKKMLVQKEHRVQLNK